nr:unnamed protein product [Callosobruchus chinensis]
MPPELWMNPAAVAAATMRYPGADGPVPNPFFGMGARPFFPPGGGPPLYPRYPLPTYNTLYRPRQPPPVKPEGVNI